SASWNPFQDASPDFGDSKRRDEEFAGSLAFNPFRNRRGRPRSQRIAEDIGVEEVSSHNSKSRPVVNSRSIFRSIPARGDRRSASQISFPLIGFDRRRRSSSARKRAASTSSFDSFFAISRTSLLSFGEPRTSYLSMPCSPSLRRCLMMARFWDAFIIAGYIASYITVVKMQP